MTNIAKAIIQVMKAVKGIDKTMTVGEGKNSYKGVSDQVVKQKIGEEMEKAGLCIIPTKQLCMKWSSRFSFRWTN